MFPGDSFKPGNVTAQAFGNGHRILIVAGMQNNNKLFTSIAIHRFRAPNIIADIQGQRTQNNIPVKMAVIIIHFLKVIDIQ